MSLLLDIADLPRSTYYYYTKKQKEPDKYTFYANEKSKEQNFPERRRDFRKPVSAATINNYNWDTTQMIESILSNCHYL